MPQSLQLATLAGGCFWCTEAIFQRLKGVNKVTSGYTGGEKDNPSYKEVCEGATGHAEAIQIEFDPKVISYETLLEVFFKTHDPTTLNRQGNDVGTQYRSVIYYHDENQKQLAEKLKSQFQKECQDKIVTEIIPFEKFFNAENYHQNYYNINKDLNPYCQIIIDPKITKLYKQSLKGDFQLKDENSL